MPEGTAGCSCDCRETRLVGPSIFVTIERHAESSFPLFPSREAGSKKREFLRRPLTERGKESRKDPKHSKPIPSRSFFSRVPLPFAPRLKHGSLCDNADGRWETGKSGTRRDARALFNNLKGKREGRSGNDRWKTRRASTERQSSIGYGLTRP